MSGWPGGDPFIVVCLIVAALWLFALAVDGW